ncbi:MAG: beta-propeller fold lactonase family protein [Betaproteobacteria bacterium]
MPQPRSPTQRATVTIRPTRILQALASTVIPAVFLGMLGAAPIACAADEGLTMFPYAWLVPTLLHIRDHSKPAPIVYRGLAYEIIIGVKPLEQRSSGPSAQPAPKSFANYGALTNIAGTEGSDHCLGSLGGALDPSGKFVYMSGGFGSPGRLCAFAVDPVTKAWTPVTLAGGIPAATGTNPGGVAIEPSGRFVYVAGGLIGSGEGGVFGYAIDRGSGVPVPLPGSPFPTGGSLPRPVVIDGAGRFMYVGQSVGSFDGSIAVFAIDAASGALTQIPGSPFPNVANGGGIAALALAPDGRILFTGGSALATYAVNPLTGVPTRLAARAGNYYGLTVDPTGQFLFAPDSTVGVVHGFSISAGGALTSAGTPQTMGSVTRSTTAVVSVADLVYVGNYATGDVYGFRINPATGALTSVAASPFALPPLAAAFVARVELPPSLQVDAGENVVASIGVYGGRPPYTWSIVSGALPPGSALNATTGVFSGVLGAAGTYSFTVQVADSLGATTAAAKSITVVGSAVPSPVTVVEFYNAALDHYFITYVADEIAKLDNGTFKGWTRTGLSFNAYATAQSGTSAVCRIYIPPGKGDGHFFGRDANECDGTMNKNPTFILESDMFLHLYLPTLLGTCATGQVPVYRVFSNRADANHRYTTDRAVRDQMVTKGWLAEGDGTDTIVMCAPG